MDFTKCSNCGGDIAGYGDGDLRHYGTSIAHREYICLATLRAQLAEVTQERDEALLRAHRLGWLVNEMRAPDIYYVLGDHWNFDRTTLDESIRAAMQESQP